LAVEYFVDKPSGSKEKNVSNKEDIVNAFLFSKRSWCKMSKNFLNAISCSYILNAARGKFNYDLLSLLTVDDVQEKAQYHSACITNYLLKAFCLQKIQ
jgi:hypothetical protein